MKDQIRKVLEKFRKNESPEKTDGSGRCYALLVSVGDYHIVKEKNLSSWQMDQNLIRTALVKGLKVEEENIRICGQDGFVSLPELARALRTFSEMLSERDTFLFYFSGHGNGKELLFSDRAAELAGILRVMDRLPTKSRIAILDCCYSGAARTGTVRQFQSEEGISDFAGRGLAILASSAADEVSRLGPGGDHSVYSGMVSGAMQSVRHVQKGCLSLNAIHTEILALMEDWNRRNPKKAQHPVFRSSMGGTIYFQVSEYHPYVSKRIFKETPAYILHSVKPMNAPNIRRLCAFVIPKGAGGLKELPAITKEIAAQIKRAQVYASESEKRRFLGQPARAIWCYFAHDESDLIHHLHYAYTIWAADEEMKKRYFSETGNFRIVDGICIFENTDYAMLKQLQQPEMPVDETLASRKQLLALILSMAEQFIASLHEQENGTETLAEIKTQYQSWIRKVKQTYLRLSDEPVPPDGLYAWASAVDDLAGAVVDLAFLLEQTDGAELDARSRWLIEYTVRQYYEAIERVKIEENAQMIRQKEKKD